MISITEWQSECEGPVLWRELGWNGVSRREWVEMQPRPAGTFLWGTGKATSGASWLGAAVLAPSRQRRQGRVWLPALQGVGGCSGPPGSQRLVPGGTGKFTTQAGPFPIQGSLIWDTAKADPKGLCLFTHLSPTNSEGLLGPFLAEIQLSSPPQSPCLHSF